MYDYITKFDTNKHKHFQSLNVKIWKNKSYRKRSSTSTRKDTNARWFSRSAKPKHKHAYGSRHCRPVDNTYRSFGRKMDNSERLFGSESSPMRIDDRHTARPPYKAVTFSRQENVGILRHILYALECMMVFEWWADWLGYTWRDTWSCGVTGSQDEAGFWG